MEAPDSAHEAEAPGRAVERLRRALEAEPERQRLWLELADAYADAGAHAEAIPWYEKRYAAGGPEREAVWYARYRQGMAHLALGQADLGVALLIDAHEQRPTRAEAIVALARHYRLLGQNEQAFRLARQAQAIPLPDSDRLGIREAAYGRDPLEEISITAFYVRERELGLDACERLLAARDAVSVRDAGHTAKNELFYLPRAIEVLRAGKIEVSRALTASPERHLGLAHPSTTEYVPKNPALVRLGARVFLNVPLVNYRHENGRLFFSNDPDRVIRTRSAVVEWDVERAAVKSERESEITLPDSWFQAPTVRGLEDQRWVAHRGGVWLTATTYHVTGVEGEPRVVLGRMREDMSGVAELKRLTYEREQRCEKNWIPLSLDDELFLIYSYDPFVVLRADTESGVCTEVARWTPPWSARRWRGGAPPVPHPGRPDRFVMLVHETAWLEHQTVYLHRFVELSAARRDDGEREFKLERYSRLFSFDHHGVEYACGLLDRGDGSLLVTFGSEEREARFAELDWRAVDTLLNTKYY